MTTGVPISVASNNLHDCTYRHVHSHVRYVTASSNLHDCTYRHVHSHVRYVSIHISYMYVHTCSCYNTVLL